MLLKSEVTVLIIVGSGRHCSLKEFGCLYRLSQPDTSCVALFSTIPGRFRIDAGSRSGLIRVMTTYIISEAKPKLGALVRQAAAGKTIYLLNGKDMVALVPARPTHEAAAGLDVPAVNRRLAASERTPSAPWRPGDAGRLAKQVLRKRTAP